MDLSIKDIESIKNNDIFKNMRTTPIVRDALIHLAKGISLDDYIANVREYFEGKINNLNEDYKKIIKKQLYPIF